MIFFRSSSYNRPQDLPFFNKYFFEKLFYSVLIFTLTHDLPNWLIETLIITQSCYTIRPNHQKWINKYVSRTPHFSFSEYIYTCCADKEPSVFFLAWEEFSRILYLALSGDFANASIYQYEGPLTLRMRSGYISGVLLTAEGGIDVHLIKIQTEFEQRTLETKPSPRESFWCWNL